LIPRRFAADDYAMSTKDDSQPRPKLPSTIATPKFKRGLKGFLTDVSREMKKVHWPTRRETNRLTFVVLTLCILIAVMLQLMGWFADTIIAILTKGRV